MTKCATCGKKLSRCKTVFAMLGVLYCSKQCAVEDLLQANTNPSAKKAIEKYVDECGEEVSAKEIGL